MNHIFKNEKLNCRLDQQAAQFELSALAPMVALLLLDMIQGLSR